MKTLSIALAVLGLLAGTVLIGWFGFDQVAKALLSIGWHGLGLLLACQVLLFALLGVAWNVIATPAGAGLLWVFVWGRLVRDAAANCLPFSAVGGFVLGARAITLHGVAWPLATASVVVDVTAEMLAQLALTLIGLCLLIAHDPASPLALPLAIGLGLAIAATAGLIAAQRGAGSILASLVRRIARSWFGDARDRVSLLQGEVDRIYARRFRLALGALLHLLGWIGTAFITWVAYRLLGLDVGFADALAIEALLRAVVSVAFVVPASAGVQEAGYAGIGALFGIPPELSLGVSLLSRARDLAIGVPVLLAWQCFEVRRLRLARMPRQLRRGRPSSG